MSADQIRARLYARFHGKRAAYHATFLVNGQPHPNAARVLADLKRVARIERGGIVISPVTRMVDPLATAYLAGQRDVYLRILKFLSLETSMVETDDGNRTDTATTD